MKAMEEAIKERLNRLLRSRRYSINSFAKETGVWQKTLNNQLAGNTALSANTLCVFIEKFPDVSAEWILRGTEPMLLNGQATQSNIHGDNINGNNAVVNKADCNKFIEMLQEKDRQIAELITIIKKERNG